MEQVQFTEILLVW